MLGTAIAIVAVFAAAALAVRSASPPRTAPVGPAEADEPARLEPLPPAPVETSSEAEIGLASREAPPTDVTAGVAVPVTALLGAPSAVALLTSGSATPASLPVLYAPPAVAHPTAPARRTAEPATTNGTSRRAVAGPLGITDDRALEDVLSSAFEIAPARARPAIRLVIGITVLSFLFAVGSIVAVRSVTMLVDKMLH